MDKELKEIIISGVLFILAIICSFIDKMPLILNINIISLVLFISSYLVVGYKVIKKALNNIIHGEIFDENFLMLIASIGAFVIMEYSEGVAVMLFYNVGEYFQDFAVEKTRKSVGSLMNIKPEFASILKNNEITIVDPYEVEIGDILVIKKGEKVPVDGIVESGETYLDVKALTGESNPIKVKLGDEVLSGSINDGEVINVKATKEYFNSTVSKILDLVENVAGRKSKAENFIAKFSRVYTPIVCILAVLLFFIPSIITKDFSTWGYRALSFLVVSCPCALVISVPLSFFAGIGGASKYGILVKGGNYFDIINNLKTIVFDKTGTLTKGVFEVTSIYPESNKDEIIRCACIAENGSNHPIAKCILKFSDNKIIGDYSITEVSGKGVIAINDNEKILVGNHSLLTDNDINVDEIDCFGTAVYVAKNNECLGYIIVSDVVKDEARSTIEDLRNLCIKTVMLTGDSYDISNRLSKELKLDYFKSQLLPGDKVAELENLLEKDSNNKVAFVGDGINDAPVLMLADLGISMGGIGSDSAIEASDVVLMHDNLDAIVKLKDISRKTIKIVNENITFVLFIKILVLLLCAIGVGTMWLAVFADVGVSIIAILNSMRALKN